MIEINVHKRKLYSAIVILALLQSGLWYGGLADLIPVALLNQWNRISLIFTIILIVLCVTKKRRVNTVTCLLVLYKLIFIVSTCVNGRNVEITEFTRFMCIVLAMEYFEDEMDNLISVLMLIFELMVYYNFITLSVGPDLYGAYYTALGYDNAATPYLLTAYLVAICYCIEKGKYIRSCIMIVVIHMTLLITMVGTGLVAIFFVDVLLLFHLLHNIKISFIKSYCIYLTITIAIVVCRIQNLFSFIIVDMLGKDLTFTGRTKDWDLAFGLIPQKIFLGYGIMDQSTEKMILGDVYTHNAVLEQLFRGGIVSILIFIAVVYLVSKANKYGNKISRRKSGFLLCIMCGFWITSLTEVTFEGVIFYCALTLHFHFTKFWVKNNL